MIKIVLLSILSVAICFFASAGLALEPHEILVIANRDSARSVGLAEYYMKKRNIPKDNLLKLWLTDKELCSRDEYNRKVAGKVRKHLRENDKQRRIRCLLVMYGMPLKVAPPEMTAAPAPASPAATAAAIPIRAEMMAVRWADSSCSWPRAR